MADPLSRGLGRSVLDVIYKRHFHACSSSFGNNKPVCTQAGHWKRLARLVGVEGSFTGKLRFRSDGMIWPNHFTRTLLEF